MKDLRDFIETYRSRSWRAGKNDCALFCAAWIKVKTGKDFARGYRGKYSSVEKGLELIGGLKAYATECLGEPDAILTARKGDIAYRTSDGSETVGVVLGTRVACPGKDGLYFSELNDWECVFHG